MVEIRVLSGDGGFARGAGFAVGRGCYVTAAHVVFDPAGRCWARALRVVGSRHVRPGAGALVRAACLRAAWIGGGRVRDDLALLSIGTETRHAPRGRTGARPASAGTAVICAPSPRGGRRAALPVSGLRRHRETLTYRCGAAAGASGAPVLEAGTASWRVIGVHVGADRLGRGVGARLSGRWRGQLTRWIVALGSDAPVSMPRNERLHRFDGAAITPWWP